MCSGACSRQRVSLHASLGVHPSNGYNFSEAELAFSSNSVTLLLRTCRRPVTYKNVEAALYLAYAEAGVLVPNGGRLVAPSSCMAGLRPTTVNACGRLGWWDARCC